MKKSKKIGLVLGIGAVMASGAAISAMFTTETIDTSATTARTAPAGSCNVGSWTALQDCISASADNIKLTANITQGSSDPYLALNSGTTTAIYGENHTITTNTMIQVGVNGGKGISFYDLTFAFGSGDRKTDSLPPVAGPLIYITPISNTSNEAITFDNITINGQDARSGISLQNNHSLIAMPTDSTSGWSNDAPVDIIFLNSTITNNTVSSVISSRLLKNSSLTIKDSNVSNNTGTGTTIGINALDGNIDVDISDTIITKNTGHNAISAWLGAGSEITIKDSIISDNTSGVGVMARDTAGGVTFSILGDTEIKSNRNSEGRVANVGLFGNGTNKLNIGDKVRIVGASDFTYELDGDGDVTRSADRDMFIAESINLLFNEGKPANFASEIQIGASSYKDGVWTIPEFAQLAELPNAENMKNSLVETVKLNGVAVDAKNIVAEITENGALSIKLSEEFLNSLTEGRNYSLTAFSSHTEPEVTGNLIVATSFVAQAATQPPAPEPTAPEVPDTGLFSGILGRIQSIPIIATVALAAVVVSTTVFGVKTARRTGKIGKMKK
jgi:hypothetical protein